MFGKNGIAYLYNVLDDRELDIVYLRENGGNLQSSGRVKHGIEVDPAHCESPLKSSWR